MFELLKRLLLPLLRIPAEPSPPTGDRGSLRVFRAAPRYLHYRIAVWSLAQPMALGSTLIGVWLFQRFVVSHTGGALAVILILAEVSAVALVLAQMVLTLALLRLDYELRWYMVTDRSIRIREGAWRVREMTLSLANIQNISVTRGPLQRLLGIADVKVMTAGGGGGGDGEPHGKGEGVSMHTGHFRGVDNASEIRDVVRERLRRYRDAGLGDPDDGGSAARMTAGSLDVAALDAAGEIRREARALRKAAEAVR